MPAEKGPLFFFVKRLWDILFSGAGLIILLPLFVIIAIFIKIDSPGPVFYRQARIGRNGKPFKIYKFRSMYVGADSKGHLITVSGDPRITRVGKILRKYKMDELPQLINVFKGDMSLVGPRPEVKKYVEMFRNDFKEILRVKPGITDFAAIEFRNEEEILKKSQDPEKVYIEEVLPQKMALYKKYLKEMSFITDLKLILLTLWRVLKA